jgi:dTDP-4-amino-4,6-dideoxygalactose transaminase
MKMNRNIDFIPFARPSVGREETAAAARVIESAWLTTGNEALAFEEEFAAFIGSEYAFALSSATAGLHLALEAIGIKEDDFVITTPYTFASTAEVIRYFRAHPLFVDIEESAATIDPALLETALQRSNRIKGIIPVHLGGHPADMVMINQIAVKGNIPVIEDAAHSFPSFYEGRHFGTMGSAGVFSFYATKTITTGEGGMLVTDDKLIAEKVRTMRLHGIDRNAWDRYGSMEPAWRYDLIEAGYKYNMPDISAAIGRVQLKKAMDFLDKRRAIAEQYTSMLQNKEYFSLPEGHPAHSWHLYRIEIRPEHLNISRDKIIAELSERGIGLSVHYIPLHIMSYYRKLYGFAPTDFPVAYRIFQNSISLPIYPDLTPDQVERIVRELTKVCEGAYKRSLYA